MNPFVDAEIVDPVWRFTSVIEKPNGHRVEVVISIPERIATSDVREQAEIAQMVASSAFAINDRSAANRDDHRARF